MLKLSKPYVTINKPGIIERDAHRMLGLFELEGTFRGHLVQYPVVSLYLVYGLLFKNATLLEGSLLSQKLLPLSSSLLI